MSTMGFLLADMKGKQPLPKVAQALLAIKTQSFENNTSSQVLINNSDFKTV